MRPLSKNRTARRARPAAASSRRDKKPSVGPLRQWLRRVARPLRRGARSKRPWVALVLAIPLALMFLWALANQVAWAGPLLADTARAVVGVDAVSRLEEIAYDAADRWNRFWRSEAQPEAHWNTSPQVLVTPVPNFTTDALPPTDAADKGEFPPANVGPLFREMAAPGDGVWVPVVDPNHPDEPPVLYKTLIHPDRKRSWGELFVVAIDLRRAQIFAAAGTLEPKASTQEGQQYKRRGVIPEVRYDGLLAAFNGGFKAEHGQWGMKVDDVTLLPPRDRGCTIAGFADHTLRIGTWTALKESEPEMRFWRQTPSCMVEKGTLNPGLVNEESISWGAALGGGTVVRRSAFGLNPARNIAFVGVSNATTARAIATGMQHAGARDVAQLDINWSYPHFIMFRQSKAGQRQGYSLFDGFAYENNEYLSRAATRDFFYVVRKDSSVSQRDK